MVVTKDSIDDDKPVSAVVIQEPADGTKAEKGTAVTLSVARGSGKVAVPRIVELRRPDAEAALQAAGLTWTFDEVPSETVAADVVVTQSPEPSAKVDKGSSVAAAVSTGPTTTVPSRTVATNGTVPPARSSPSGTVPTTSGPSAPATTIPVVTTPITSTPASPVTTAPATTVIVIPTTAR